MSAIERLRDAAARLDAYDAIVGSARWLVELLRGDDLDGELLYAALDDACGQLERALDAAQWPSATLADSGTVKPARTTVSLAAGTLVVPLDSPPVGGTQVCATCGQNRPRDQFHKLGRGISKSCAECVSERNRRNLAKRTQPREADDKEPV